MCGSSPAYLGIQGTADRALRARQVGDLPHGCYRASSLLSAIRRRASAYSFRVSCFSESLFHAGRASAFSSVVSIQRRKYSASPRERTGWPATLTQTGMVAANGYGRRIGCRAYAARTRTANQPLPSALRVLASFSLSGWFAGFSSTTTRLLYSTSTD